MTDNLFAWSILARICSDTNRRRTAFGLIKDIFIYNTNALCSRRSALRDSDKGEELLYLKKISDAKMIGLPGLDTVMNSRDLGMTMEAIMTRDQRTTSHRVLERGSQCAGISVASYQKIVGSCAKSSMSTTNVKTTRATTSQSPVDESPTDSRDTRIQETESDKNLVRCSKRRDICNCQKDTRRDNCVGNRDSRGPTFRHKNNSTTWLSKSRRQLRDYALHALWARNRTARGVG